MMPYAYAAYRGPTAITGILYKDAHLEEARENFRQQLEHRATQLAPQRPPIESEVFGPKRYLGEGDDLQDVDFGWDE